MITTPGPANVILLTELIDTGNFLDGLTWRLYSTQVSITPQTALGDLTEATFPGYAPLLGSGWGTPFIDTSGNGVVIGGNAQFTAVGAQTGETEYGYYVTSGSGAGDKLVFLEAFPNPISIANPGDGIVVQQTYALPGPIGANTTGP